MGIAPAIDLGHRLRASDQAVLAELLTDPGVRVRANLSCWRGGWLDWLEVDAVLNEALYRVWENRREFRGDEAALKAHFRRTAENAARNHVKAKARRRERPVDAHLLRLADLRPTDAHEPAADSRAARIRGLIYRALPLVRVRYRLIILADMLSTTGVAPDEPLSAQFGVSLRTIRKYRRHAWARLTQILGKQCEYKGYLTRDSTLFGQT